MYTNIKDKASENSGSGTKITPDQMHKIKATLRLIRSLW